MKTLNSPSTPSIFISREDRQTPLHLPAFAVHNSYEIYILTEGIRNIFIGTSLFSTTACDVSLIPPNAPHRSFGTAYKGISIEFSQEYIDDKFTTKEAKRITECFKNRIVTLPESEINKIWNSKPENISDSAEKKDFFLHIIHLLEKYASGETETGKLTFSNDLFTIGTYIQEHYLEIQSLDELAEHFSISKSYLCRIFKKRTGLTVITYLNSLKVQHACNLLVETDLPINEISRICGFESSIYFTRVFKKLMECTPREKRKNNADFYFSSI